MIITILQILLTVLITAKTVLAIFEIIAQMDKIEREVQEDIDSSILREQRILLIHLTPEYDPSQNYPFMYVLDESSHDLRISGIAEILNRAGIVQDMIIVKIPNTEQNRDLTPHYHFL